MKREYISPLTSVYVCRRQELLTVSSVGSNVEIEWGGEDIDGLLESDAPMLEEILLGK
jgi:hypothetical protein